MVNEFVDAVQFLTRIPIEVSGRRPSVGRAMPWFPVVGALVGALVGGAVAALWYGVPPLVAATVAIALGLLVTGAFHEDGLGDVADAFAGGTTIERRLQILKDPRQGTYGVCAIAAALLVRVACVASMPGPGAMFATLVAAGTLGRASSLLLAATVPAATDDGLAASAAGELSSLGAWISIAAAVGITAVAVGWWAAPLALAAGGAALVVGALASSKIGGVNGDVLGATEVISECLCLVVAAGLATHGRLWWS
jgi:adenosylcobinamide-GDP ribazoletransferase